ncbi:MAG: hypothetical protein NTW74_08540, partial [Acidobacteria bacterium]|nr:hypothetical protein [Acidobacteriota bacterium]
QPTNPIRKGGDSNLQKAMPQKARIEAKRLSSSNHPQPRPGQSNTTPGQFFDIPPDRKNDDARSVSGGSEPVKLPPEPFTP